MKTKTEKQLERELVDSIRADEWEFRHGWDGDWSEVVDQYDGTR